MKDKKNKSLLRVYINLVAKFAECSGKEFFNHGKFLIQHLLSSLSDKQALVRCDVVNALHKMENGLGPEFILNNLAVFLQNNENKDSQSVEMKQEVLNWLLKNVGLLMKFPNLKGLIPMFLGMLVDKNKEIRLMADQLNEKIVLTLGPNIFAESIKNMRSTLIPQIKPLFEKYCLAYKSTIPNLTNTNEKDNNNNNKPIINDNFKPSMITNEKLTNKIITLESHNNNQNNQNNKLLFINNKSGRMEQEILNPWPIDLINDDLIENLKEKMILIFSDAIGKKLFSFDLKRALEGLIQLKQNISAMSLIENSDLIFKWVLFKLFNYVNDEFIGEMLDFIFMTLQTISQNQTSLFESEARIILNCLKKVKEINFNKYREKIETINNLLLSFFPCEYINSFWGNPQFYPPKNVNKLMNINDQMMENQLDFEKKSHPRNSFGVPTMALENFNNFSIMNESPSPMQTSNLTKKMILQNNLEVLNWSSIPGKIDALLNICNFLSEETLEYKGVIEEESTNIAKVICALFRPDALDNNSNAPDEFINFLVKITQKIFKNKFLLDNIAYDVMCELVENILQKLLLEDAHNKPPANIFNNNQQPPIPNTINPVNNNKPIRNNTPLKNLNSLMLTILEVCSPNTIYQVLFDLMIKHRKLNPFSKFIALLIKCLLKLTKIMENLLPRLDLSKLFLKFHLYCCECSIENFQNTEDLGVKTIKTIINEIINIKGAAIMDYYHIISTHEKPDKCIFRLFLKKKKFN